MFNIEKDGTINERFPGDYKKSLGNKAWICSNCGKKISSSSNNIFYVRSLGFVYHRDSDGRLYPCKEEGSVRYVEDRYWENPLKINDDIFTIEEPIKNIDIKETTKKWYIPKEFINREFSNFLMNINVSEICGKKIDKIPIKNSSGSLEEWATHFRLEEIHGITLDHILNLLENKGCALINKKENYIQHHNQNIVSLEEKIESRIEEK